MTTPEPTKVCTAHGGDPLPLTAFALNHRRPDGHEAQCKACRNRADREKRSEMAEKRRQSLCERSEAAGTIDGPSEVLRDTVAAISSPLLLPVALAPTDCGCPKRHIDGVLWRLHRTDCAEIGIFNRYTPAFAQKPDAEAKYHGSRYSY